MKFYYCECCDTGCDSSQVGDDLECPFCGEIVVETADHSNEPDWEMQAEYDSLHGTINGEDPGVVEMRELWGE